MYCLLPVFFFFFVCLTIIDTFLCLLGHLEHDFPCAVPSARLYWRPREVLRCLASSSLSVSRHPTPMQHIPQVLFQMPSLRRRPAAGRFLHLITQSTQHFLADSSLDLHYHFLFVLPALKSPLLANFWSKAIVTAGCKSILCLSDKVRKGYLQIQDHA